MSTIPASATQAQPSQYSSSYTAIPLACMVPGLPHLKLAPTGWETLKTAMQQLGQQVQTLNPDVLVIYSAQWMSVLGHSIQMDPHPQGLHVDDNWYALNPGGENDLPFDFPVDVPLSQQIEQAMKTAGFATKGIHVPGFPMDTGTLVVQHFLNPQGNIPVVILSSNIYASAEDTVLLGNTVAQTIEKSGKRAVVINCSALSHRFHTTLITPEADTLARPEDEQWNQKVLACLQAGHDGELMTLLPDFIQQAGPEMQFKGHHFLRGVFQQAVPDRFEATGQLKAHVLAYGPIWGTGAAVVTWELTHNA